MDKQEAFQIVADSLEELAQSVRRLASPLITLQPQQPTAITSVPRRPRIAHQPTRQKKQPAIASTRGDGNGEPKRRGRAPGPSTPAVLQYVRENGPANATDCGHALGIDPSRVSQILSKLLAMGAVVRIDRGQYQADPEFTE